MKRSSVPVVVVDPALKLLVSSSGGLLLTHTMRCSGLDRALSTALAPGGWGGRFMTPAKVLLDLAIAVALGGDCAADIAVVRAQPALFSEVIDPDPGQPLPAIADDPAAAQHRARADRPTAHLRLRLAHRGRGDRAGVPLGQAPRAPPAAAVADRRARAAGAVAAIGGVGLSRVIEADGVRAVAPKGLAVTVAFPGERQVVLGTGPPVVEKPAGWRCRCGRGEPHRGIGAFFG